MRDYSRDVSMVRKLARAALVLDVLSTGTTPFEGISGALGRTTAESFFKGLNKLAETSYRTQRFATTYWEARYDAPYNQDCPLVCSLWLACEEHSLGTLHTNHSAHHYRDVLGVPVGSSPYDNCTFYSPATRVEIFERVRAQGTSWRVTDSGGLVPDDAALLSIIAPETQRIIERTRRFDSCRSWILWGPPRGGKSVAARQIAYALAGSWVRVCGKAAALPAVWEALNVLRPCALILDDLDTNAGNESFLLGALEQAREWADVIVSTLNVLPSQGEESKEHHLRGAVLTVGRAGDEEPVEYRGLAEPIRAVLAPDVPEDQRAPDVLAAYLVEMQKRVRAGVASPEDLEEMRRRMAAVGDR